jgi:hypothetical protein
MEWNATSEVFESHSDVAGKGDALTQCSRSNLLSRMMMRENGRFGSFLDSVFV